MFRLGILTERQYAALGEGRRFSGARVAYSLLAVGDHPSEEQIRIFEDISFTLRTSNGTCRTTFRNRFEEIDRASLRWIAKLYPQGPRRVQDRAVSHGLTSAEWAQRLLAVYPDIAFEASDLLSELVELAIDGGEIFIVEPGGVPLQYIKPPFAVGLQHPEPRRYPVNHWVAAWGRRRWKRLRLPPGWMHTSGGPGYRVRTIPYIHPLARKLSQANPRFKFCVRSVFEETPAACEVLRTMNILNRDYFSDRQLQDGVKAAFRSLECGGIWIVGRTLEEDFINHATFLRRQPDGWEVLERIGKGSDIEELALRLPVGV
jgi:hypothetical protein